MGFPGSSAGKESACIAGDLGFIPGLGNFPGEGIGYPLQYYWIFLVSQKVKNRLKCRKPGFNPRFGKILWRRHGNPLHSSCLENPHRQRSLAGYSPCGCKESDTTEQLNTAHS